MSRNDVATRGKFKPGAPAAKPSETNQMPHKKQARHNLKSKSGLARVAAGLKKAFPSSPAPVSSKANAATTKITRKGGF